MVNLHRGKSVAAVDGTATPSDRECYALPQPTTHPHLATETVARQLSTLTVKLPVPT